jgi:hypothetical protein
MRKIAVLAVGAAAVVFGVVSIAFAANTYTVSIAKVTPSKAGTTKNPKAVKVNFGYQVGETAGNRPSVTTDYVISFGSMIQNGRKWFKGNKTCTVAQAGYVSGSAPRCPSTANAGGGTVQNLAGLSNDPTSKIPCQLKLTTFVGDGKAVPAAANDGIAVRNDLVLALKGGPPTCPLAVDAAIPAAIVGSSVRFHVKKIPFQQPAAGIDNSVINVTSNTGKSVVVRVRGRRVTHGLFESKGCPRGGYPVTVTFKDASGATSNATKRAPCTK